MTSEDSSNTAAKAETKVARYGRAAAWFTAGALGATVLTGVAMAAVTDSDSGEANPQIQTEGRGGPGGQGGHPGMRGPGKHHGGPGAGPMLHGEGVIEDKDGNYRDVATQKGKVTAVSDTSITVVSEDGHSATYTVTDDTKVHKDREEKSTTDISADDIVHVVAKKDGDSLTAVRIGAMSPEQAAEREERRDEMRQRFQERREQRQNGQTTESGFWGEPPTEAATT